MKRNVFIVLFAFAALSGIWLTAFGDEPFIDDVVMITDISPHSVTSGDEVEVTVKVAYALRSCASGAIRLTANTLEPNGDHTIASAPVKKGLGEVTLTARIVPRYWSHVVPFGVNAALVVPFGDTFQTKALSVDRMNFKIAPAMSSGGAGSLPPVYATYVDGISILSVAPESYAEGIEQEIVVRVGYELLSREEGEIGLGVSDGRPASRLMIGRTRVKIGKGEAEVHGRFVPIKTAGLPFARLLLTLDEYPRAKVSIPLGWDEGSIEVVSPPNDSNHPRQRGPGNRASAGTSSDSETPSSLGLGG